MIPILDTSRVQYWYSTSRIQILDTSKYWTLSPIMSQVSSVTLRELVLHGVESPWCCKHSLKRGVQHSSCKSFLSSIIILYMIIHTIMIFEIVPKSHSFIGLLIISYLACKTPKALWTSSPTISWHLVNCSFILS